MAYAEQIDRHERNRRRESYKRWLKTRINRLRRQAERRDVENAPGKVRELTRGYSS